MLHTDLPLPDELLARTNPNPTDLGIALAAGAAGGFVAVRTEASGALPGVGIAVALVPPLATVGLTAGLGMWGLSFGALLLFATNLVAIVLAAGLVFVARGPRPSAMPRDGLHPRPRWASSSLGVIVVGVPLLAHSLQRLEQGDALSAAAREAVEWAPDLMLTKVVVDGSVDPIAVTIGITGLDAPPDVKLLATGLAEYFGAAVDVDVIFVPLTSASGPAP